ncbi:unnamed protein product [Ixodes persulcatus]
MSSVTGTLRSHFGAVGRVPLAVVFDPLVQVFLKGVRGPGRAQGAVLVLERPPRAVPVAHVRDAEVAADEGPALAGLGAVQGLDARTTRTTLPESLRRAEALKQGSSQCCSQRHAGEDVRGVVTPQSHATGAPEQGRRSRGHDKQGLEDPRGAQPHHGVQVHLRPEGTDIIPMLTNPHPSWAPGFLESLPRRGRREHAGAHLEPASGGPLLPCAGAVQPAHAEEIGPLDPEAVLEHIHADACAQGAQQLTNVPDESPGELVHLAADAPDTHHFSGTPGKRQVPHLNQNHLSQRYTGTVQCGRAKVSQHRGLSQEIRRVLGPGKVRVVAAKQPLRYTDSAASPEQVGEQREAQKGQQLEQRDRQQAQVDAVHPVPFGRAGVRSLVVGGRGRRAAVQGHVAVLDGEGQRYEGRQRAESHRSKHRTNDSLQRGAFLPCIKGLSH